MKTSIYRLLLPACALFAVGIAVGFRIQARTTSHRPEVQPEAALTSETPAAEFRIIELEEFRRILDSREGVILDARREAVYPLGHVPHAINLPRYKVATNIREIEGLLRSKKHLLVIYCCGTGCQDADMEAHELIKLGYSNVAVFRGGMNQWREHNLPEEH